MIVKSPRLVCTRAVYFFEASMTVGGGVVRSAMQVTIPLWQPESLEVAAVEPHEIVPIRAKARLRAAGLSSRFTCAKRQQ